MLLLRIDVVSGFFTFSKSSDSNEILRDRSGSYLS
jgi:hypothetical protein